MQHCPAGSLVRGTLYIDALVGGLLPVGQLSGMLPTGQVSGVEMAVLPYYVSGLAGSGAFLQFTALGTHRYPLQFARTYGGQALSQSG